VLHPPPTAPAPQDSPANRAADRPPPTETAHIARPPQDSSPRTPRTKRPPRISQPKRVDSAPRAAAANDGGSSSRGARRIRLASELGDFRWDSAPGLGIPPPAS
jgi:hypothetical protein